MMKTIVASLAILLIGSFCHAQEDQMELFTYEGTVIEYEDSGLGPFYQIALVNVNQKDSLFSLIMVDLVADLQTDQIVGKKVRISYQMESENHLDSIQLITAKKPDINDKDTTFSTVYGKFKTCVQGDMGSYLDILLPSGEFMSFITDFYCPEDIKKGDEVIVFYEIYYEISIKAIKLLDEKT